MTLRVSCTSLFLQVSSAALLKDTCSGRADARSPTDYTKNAKTFSDTVQKDADSFVPPGEKIAAYIPSNQTLGNATVEYGIYKVSKVFSSLMKMSAYPC